MIKRQHKLWGGKIPATHIVGKQQEKQEKKKKNFTKKKIQMALKPMK